MTIRATDNRTAWEAFLQNAHPPTFLQSWAWGETQRSLGEEVLRLEALEGGEVVGVAQAVTVTARRGTFLHVPHGPVVTGSARGLLEALRDEAKRRGSAFLRVSPVQEDTKKHRALYGQLGFRNAPIHLHAERLWILDLAPSEDALLHGMRKTTRNLLRRAERDGVTVRLTAAREDLPTFLALYAETARRERFVPFTTSALKAEFHAFAKDQNAVLAIADYQNQPLAAAMILFTPWSAFYHHGASSRLRPHIPAAYALQWSVVQEAKRRGCAEYNFWGIAPQQAIGHRPRAIGTGTRAAPVNQGLRPNPSGLLSHPWAGLTLFKTGFGGREVPLVQAQDLPLSPRYWLTYAVDTLRRWKRGV